MHKRHPHFSLPPKDFQATSNTRHRQLKKVHQATGDERTMKNYTNDEFMVGFRTLERKNAGKQHQK